MNEQPKTKQTSNDSITNVSFSDANVNHVNIAKKIVYNGRYNTLSFRGNKNLYLAFKTAAKHRYGSVCKAFEAFMVSVVALDQIPNVNISNTVEIKQIVHRNLSKERRNLTYVACEVKDCDVEAVAFVPYKGRSLNMCAKHAAEYGKLKPPKKRRRSDYVDKVLSVAKNLEESNVIPEPEKTESVVVSRPVSDDLRAASYLAHLKKQVMSAVEGA
jgi:hypothetical protein